MLAAGRLASLILWGPPGVGKTTIARLLAQAAQMEFISISAVFSGVKDMRAAFDQARQHRATGRATLLFVDEVHRFNKAQQDGFLPHVEDGLITFVGATTENPSFEVNAALLSRAQVLVLKRLDEPALEALIARAETHLGAPLPLDAGARAALCAMADGDGRYCLNLVEQVANAGATEPLDVAGLAALVQRRAPQYDKGGDGHFDLISALHKSVRASDVDAALYWFARMIAAGEDPMYLARRLVRMASEDIGLADPTSLLTAVAARDAFHLLGSPEGDLALAHVVVHLASAPKSNALYTAYKSALRMAQETGSLAPPPHSVNAPTRLMKELGRGAGYAYDHDAQDGVSGQSHFPVEMTGGDGDARERPVFYTPTTRGREAAIKERLALVAKARAQRAGEVHGEGDETPSTSD